MTAWPKTAEELVRNQDRLAAERPEPWTLSESPVAVAGCAVVYGGAAGDRVAAGELGYAGAALWEDGRLLATAAASGPVETPFRFGLLALREGPLLEEALRRLGARPAVVVVQAGGRDHPRRAGLAVALGAALGLPTIGVTSRPLRAEGPPPAAPAGSLAPLFLDGELVACWVRTRTGTRPVVAHAGWRASAETAAALVLATARGRRLPEPLRLALETARRERTGPRGRAR